MPSRNEQRVCTTSLGRGGWYQWDGSCWFCLDRGAGQVLIGVAGGADATVSLIERDTPADPGHGSRWEPSSASNGETHRSLQRPQYWCFSKAVRSMASRQPGPPQRGQGCGSTPRSRRSMTGLSARRDRRRNTRVTFPFLAANAPSPAPSALAWHRRRDDLQDDRRSRCGVEPLFGPLAELSGRPRRAPISISAPPRPSARTPGCGGATRERSASTVLVTAAGCVQQPQPPGDFEGPTLGGPAGATLSGAVSRRAGGRSARRLSGCSTPDPAARSTSPCPKAARYDPRSFGSGPASCPARQRRLCRQLDRGIRHTSEVAFVAIHGSSGHDDRPRVWIGARRHSDVGPS